MKRLLRFVSLDRSELELLLLLHIALVGVLVGELSCDTVAAVVVCLAKVFGLNSGVSAFRCVLEY